MVEPEFGEFSGLDAVDRLAAEAGSWPEVAEDWQWCARFGYQVIERRGTGGGAFRLMYSRFLEEAGRPEAPLAAEAAARWTELAEAFHAASERDEPDPALWRRDRRGGAPGRRGRDAPLGLARLTPVDSQRALDVKSADFRCCFAAVMGGQSKRPEPRSLEGLQ